MILSKATEQNIYTILRLDVEQETKIKLLNLGIDEMGKITILKNRSGDVIVGINHARIALSKNISNLIEIEKI